MKKPRKSRRGQHWNTTTLRDELVARPLRVYHEDMGPVLWWTLPVSEPPWVGSPDCDDWPGYHTHFTVLILPLVVQP